MIVSAGGAKVPPAPRRLSAAERGIWRELAAAVERLGTFQPSDLLFFRLAVKTIAESESSGKIAPTARAKLRQTAASMLNAFGLSPQGRQRVTPVVDKRNAARRVLDALAEGERS
jgi:phage terminase small subunit